jgi:hypothetical protein
VHDVAAELSPDALPADDRRFARVEVRRDLRVLIVDGEPRASRRDDEVFYLETALHPGDRGDTQLDLSVVAPEELTTRRLSDFDVVFLCNVKSPDGSALRDFVRRGGGLFVALGDNVDVDTYNSELVGLLPSPLQALRTVGAIATDRDDGETHADRGQAQQLADADHNHPIFAALAEGGEAGHAAAEPFAAARFHRYALLRPLRDGDRGVVLHFADGAPALVEARIGDGRVLIFASTIDRDWNDLPIQPIFLPFMQQLTRYLGRAPMQPPDPPILIGQPHQIPISVGDRRSEVATPDGRQRVFGPDQVAGRRTFEFSDTEKPGIYRVIATGGDGVARTRPTASFVVNIDAAESDPTPIASVALAKLTGAATTKSASAVPRRRVELWHALGAALLLLLLGEALLLRRK